MFLRVKKLRPKDHVSKIEDWEYCGVHNVIVRGEQAWIGSMKLHNIFNVEVKERHLEIRGFSDENNFVHVRCYDDG